MLMNISTLSLTASPVPSKESDLDGMLTLSESSLRTTRAAIARWTRGTVAPVRPAGLEYVSAQQRWLSQAQRDLADWIRAGGFSQPCNPAAAAPAAATAMLPPPPSQLPRFLRIDTTQESADACLE